MDDYEVGTGEHMQRAFKARADQWSNTSHGEVTKNSRWWSFEARGKQFLSQKTLTLYVCIYIGFKRKWWQCLEDTPLVDYIIFGESYSEFVEVDDDGDIDDDGDSSPSPDDCDPDADRRELGA